MCIYSTGKVDIPFEAYQLCAHIQPDAGFLSFTVVAMLGLETHVKGPTVLNLCSVCNKTGSW